MKLRARLKKQGTTSTLPLGPFSCPLGILPPTPFNLSSFLMKSHTSQLWIQNSNYLHDVAASISYMTFWFKRKNHLLRISLPLNYLFDERRESLLSFSTLQINRKMKDMSFDKRSFCIKRNIKLFSEFKRKPISLGKGIYLLSIETLFEKPLGLKNFS